MLPINSTYAIQQEVDFQRFILLKLW